MIQRYVLTPGTAENLHPVRDLTHDVGYAVEHRGSSGAVPYIRERMAFGNEELMELRTQLIAAGHEPRGSRAELYDASGAPGADGGRPRATPALAPGAESARPVLPALTTEH